LKHFNHFSGYRAIASRGLQLIATQYNRAEAWKEGVLNKQPFVQMLAFEQRVA